MCASWSIEKEDFFSEEKKQKTFASLSRVYPAVYAEDTKVFWFFFSKKNILALLHLRNRLCLINHIYKFRVHIEQIGFMWRRVTVTAGIADNYGEEAVRHAVHTGRARTPAGRQPCQDDSVDPRRSEGRDKSSAYTGIEIAARLEIGLHEINEKRDLAENYERAYSGRIGFHKKPTSLAPRTSLRVAFRLRWLVWPLISSSAALLETRQ